MNFLDADEKALVGENGKAQERDNVQFVADRECRNNPTKLSQDVLRELPAQVRFFGHIIQALNCGQRVFDRTQVPLLRG